jgi:hypothetical protein
VWTDLFLRRRVAFSISSRVAISLRLDHLRRRRKPELFRDLLDHPEGRAHDQDAAKRQSSQGFPRFKSVPFARGTFFPCRSFPPGP